MFFIVTNSLSPSLFTRFFESKPAYKIVELTIENSTQQTEQNGINQDDHSPELLLLAIETSQQLLELKPDDSSVINSGESDKSGEEQPSQPSAQPQQPTRSAPNDDLSRLLAQFGYPFASGSFQKELCSEGMTCAKNGVIYGVNFPDLYCRAAAFSKGETMPRRTQNRTQKYEQFQFWLSQNRSGMDAIYIVSEPFLLSGNLIASRNELRGDLTLAMIADWRFPCKMDEGWRSVELPLHCAAAKNGELSCSLDLKKLIESLSGVAAKATETTQRNEINQLSRDLQEQRRLYQNRKKERPEIEEIDLRNLFR